MTIQAVLERLEKLRLPRALAIEARIDKRAPLLANDNRFLDQKESRASAYGGAV